MGNYERSVAMSIVDNQIKVVDEGSELDFRSKVNAFLAEGYKISSTNVAVINTPNGHASVYQAILVWTAQENTVTMPLEKYEELLIKTIEIHEQKEMSEADKQKVIEKHLELNTKHVEKVLRDNGRRFETWENQA